jgi:hypothetical protein
MRQPTGTSIVDVSDPRNPKLMAKVELPEGWHSHKVRVANDVMIVNHEKQGPDGDVSFGGGLGIYDVSKPSQPKLITKWRTHGKACIATISTAATPTSRRPPRVMSATSA